MPQKQDNKKDEIVMESVIAEINTRRHDHSCRSAEPSLKSSTENVSPPIFTKPQSQNSPKDD